MQRSHAEDDRDRGQRILPPVPGKPSSFELQRKGGKREERCGGGEQRTDRAWVARHVETFAVAHERSEQEQAERSLLDVEPLGQMGQRDPDHERDRELPCAPPAACEQPREPDEAETEGEGEDSGGARHTGRQKAAHDVVAPGQLGCERRGDPDEPDDRRGSAERLFTAEDPQPHSRHGTSLSGHGRTGPLRCLAPEAR